MDDLENIRQLYAESIRDVLRRRFRFDLSETLVNAFAKVPRERFLGPGPWLIRCPRSGLSQRLACWLHRKERTADWTTTDPKHLYRHDYLVAIDARRGINNGQPTGLASWLHFLQIKEGNRALHVGCGTGYYTAILAELVGPAGQVIGIEIDSELASRAKENLAYLDHVEILQGDGGEYDPGPTDAILVNAGVTHPRQIWLDSLRLDGRMILPLTTDNGKGGILSVRREATGYSARFVFTVSIFDCAGGRDEALSERLHLGFKHGEWRSVQSLRRESHEPNNTCWLHGEDFCFSTSPVSTPGLEGVSN
jgi:protein-L-isoaspartate(D-aspartate) O-methyltransferase